MGKAQLEQLEKYGSYLSVPHGVSMYPMIRDRRDIVEIRKIDREPVRYDLVMYIRGAEQGVIHRVLYKKDGIFVICGDNCWQREYVKPEQIRGIAVRFRRGEKWHEVDEKPYLLYVHLWCDFFWVRYGILRGRDFAKRCYRKISRMLKKEK